MSFLPNQTNLIMGEGKKSADIMIVGDCPDHKAMKSHRPIAPPTETVLEGCLHQAGLIKSSIYITNLIKDDTRIEKYWNERSKKVISSIASYEGILKDEIIEVKPKVVIAMGELSAYIFTKNGATTKTRGYPFKVLDYMVIPVLHPNKMIWGNYIWRYYLSHDLSKARELSENPDRLYQPEISTIIPETFEHTIAVLKELLCYKKLSVDIEVNNFEVSCIGFAPSSATAFSIPTDMRWTLEEEVKVWNGIAKIMESEKITKIGQNFIFDIHFLAYKMNIVTEGPIIDTMMAHSILYPDFLKALNFLGSVYTKQPYWKDMVSFKDIKAES